MLCRRHFFENDLNVYPSVNNFVKWYMHEIIKELLINMNNSVRNAVEFVDSFKVYFRLQCVLNSTAILSLISG